MTTVLDRINASQEQILELVASWQKPVVAAMQRSARLVDGSALQLPKLPLLDKLPTPTQLIEAQFAFAQKLLDANKRFAAELAEAVTVAEDAEPATPAAAPKAPAAK